jgi:sorbose reductase
VQSIQNDDIVSTMLLETVGDKLHPTTDSFLTSKVSDLFSLHNTVTLITGGARGIGLALAFAVAESGGRVAIVDASRTPHEHYKCLEEIGAKVGYYQSDVTDYPTLEKTFQQIVADFGRIDGIVTAAGICPDEPFLDRDPDSVKRTFMINTLGTYYSAQLAAKQMVKQPRLEGSSSAGSLVFIASIAAHQASRGQYTSDYCSSKGAVLSLSRQLAAELADRDIRTNCISPGYIKTDMTLNIADSRPGLAEIFVREPPMKRMGDRTDLKGAVVYLLSNASAYTTGGELLITGGMHAW